MFGYIIEIVIGFVFSVFFSIGTNYAYFSVVIADLVIFIDQTHVISFMGVYI